MRTYSQTLRSVALLALTLSACGRSTPSAEPSAEERAGAGPKTVTLTSPMRRPPAGAVETSQCQNDAQPERPKALSPAPRDPRLRVSAGEKLAQKALVPAAGRFSFPAVTPALRERQQAYLAAVRKALEAPGGSPAERETQRVRLKQGLLAAAD